LAEWLRGDVRHRIISQQRDEREIRLAELLNQLDAHLLLWLAKYKRWMPDRPDHALVYLDDEERHGLGFPTGLDQAVEAVLTTRRPLVSRRPFHRGTDHAVHTSAHGEFIRRTPTEGEETRVEALCDGSASSAGTVAGG